MDVVYITWKWGMVRGGTGRAAALRPARILILSGFSYEAPELFSDRGRRRVLRFCRGSHRGRALRGNPGGPVDNHRLGGADGRGAGDRRRDVEERAGAPVGKGLAYRAEA